jgi:hypothetical protein
MSNDDIAAQLTVSPHTVKTHINRAMTKLGAHDRAQLVITAYETDSSDQPYDARTLRESHSRVVPCGCSAGAATSAGVASSWSR